MHSKGQNEHFDVDSIMNRPPLKVGRSKVLYEVDENVCLVRMVPSLTSFTFGLHREVPGTDVLRLNFYEKAVAVLKAFGLQTAFRQRVGPALYLADLCAENPFEVIVKNFATGSTTKFYPGLFAEGYKFREPVVKFDYRRDPEDLPIAPDYLREAGCDPEEFKEVAISTNKALAEWLEPRVLIDFCIVLGERQDGTTVITSELSPDCMRLKSPEGQSLDKDLFRRGGSDEEILSTWTGLVENL